MTAFVYATPDLFSSSRRSRKTNTLIHVKHNICGTGTYVPIWYRVRTHVNRQCNDVTMNFARILLILLSTIDLRQTFQKKALIKIPPFLKKEKHTAKTRWYLFTSSLHWDWDAKSSVLAGRTSALSKTFRAPSSRLGARSFYCLVFLWFAVFGTVDWVELWGRAIGLKRCQKLSKLYRKNNSLIRFCCSKRLIDKNHFVWTTTPYFRHSCSQHTCRYMLMIVRCAP